jgi:hypothetical protein
LIMHMVTNTMLRVTMKNLETYLEVKAYIKGKEGDLFIPCSLLILSNFLMTTLMSYPRREVNLYLQIISSKLVLQARYIIWQIITSSQLQYHLCLGVR